MSDLIRREDAIKALRCEYPTMPMFKNLREEWAIKTEGFRKAEEVIMSIPSADRPQGEWIETDETDCGATVYKCSECELRVSDLPTILGKPIYSFCPNCGCRMRKENE